MVGVVKIQIFLLLVPILHNSQLAAPRPHHQLQKKTLIIVVAHFLFLSYSLSLQLQMLQQLGFFSCRVEKKRNNKQHRWTELDRRDRTFLSSFCVSATLARSVRTVTQIHCGIVGGFGRHLSPQACFRASQWCGAPRTATRPRSAAAAPASGSGSMAQEISFFQLAWPRLPSSAAPLELLLQVECLLPLPLYSARFLPNCPTASLPHLLCRLHRPDRSDRKP